MVEKQSYTKSFFFFFYVILKLINLNRFLYPLTFNIAPTVSLCLLNLAVTQHAANESIINVITPTIKFTINNIPPTEKINHFVQCVVGIMKVKRTIHKIIVFSIL